MNDNTNKEKKKIRILIFIIVLLIVGICFSLSFCNNPDNYNKNIDNDDNAVEWNGKQTIPTGNGQTTQAIEIPGFNELAFISGQTTQQVNFYNPKNNNCYFQMNLYVGNELLWKSDNVKPGYGYYEIELSQKLQQGEYPAYLNIKCYSKDGEALNSANVRFDLSVV